MASCMCGPSLGFVRGAAYMGYIISASLDGLT
jgi:hypothetical protein